MRSAVELDLPVLIDRSQADPLHRQLTEVLRAAVLTGRLPAGSRVPATRRLAAQLTVARATVLAAYEQLIGEGYLEARHGSGTFVVRHLLLAPTPPRSASAPPHPVGRGAVIDLRPGRPDTARIIDPAWRSAWRVAIGNSVPPVEPPLQGLSELRAEIAAHLRTARGLTADPDDVLVTAGTGEALALIVHALALSGRDVVVEDPGYPAARRVLTRLGSRLVPIPVDEHGLRVDRLQRIDGPLGAVLVTPSHQYPLGGILRIDRRLALLDLARRRGAVVIEDDYDSEFRYGVAPLPALAALDTDRVIHIGTLSKVLTPWLRLGFVLVPARLRAAFLAVRHDLAAPVSGIEQQALAGYLASGALRRHIARSRRDYAHRRAHLGRLLAEHPTLAGGDTRAGLHQVVRLPDDVDVPGLIGDLADHGILIADLAAYAVTPDLARDGLVLGYGAATTTDLDRAIEGLVALLPRHVHLHADRRTASMPEAAERAPTPP